MADIRLQIAQLIDHPQEWVNTLWKGLVLKITKSTDTFLYLWSDQFTFEVDRFYRKFSKYQKSQFFSILKSAIKCVDFNHNLLSSQITHRNEPVLFRIVWTTPFHRVLTHFCERSLSQAIDQICFGPEGPPPLKDKEKK